MYICALEIVPTFFKCLTNITFYKSWASLLAKLIQPYPSILWFGGGVIRFEVLGSQEIILMKIPLTFNGNVYSSILWLMFSWFGSILIYKEKRVLTFYKCWASLLVKLIQNYLPILWLEGGGVTRLEVLGSQEINLIKIPLTFYGNI